MNRRWNPWLGQVGLYLGPSSTPIYGYAPAGTYTNPSGTPLMSEELTSPSNTASEFHCYKSPDGKYVSIPFGQADAYKAQGYEAVDYSNCGSPPLHAQPVGASSFIMGQAAAKQPVPKPSSPGTVVLGAGLLALGTWGLFGTIRPKSRAKNMKMGPSFLLLEMGSISLMVGGLYLGAKGLGA